MSLLFAAETALRLAGFGYSTAPFIPRELDGEVYVLRNKHFFHKFLGWKIPQENWEKDEILIKKAKNTNTCRIFVFGESTPQGWPDHYYSFSRMLRVMLMERYPDLKFEVVNTAMRAVNSHAMLPQARACAELSPDFFIVYLGNNEVHGPFGLLSTLGNSRFPSESEISLQLEIAELRLLQLLKVLGASSLPRGGAYPGVRFDDTRLSEVYRRYEKNLREICRVAEAAEAETILCTVPVNLRDWYPTDSVFSHGTSEGTASLVSQFLGEAKSMIEIEDYNGALGKLNQAMGLENSFAATHYLMGQALWGMEKFQDACASYREAHELDGFSWVRAKPVVNEIVKRVHADLKHADVQLADVSTEIAESSDQGCPGLEMFDDYCHFTPMGSYVFARTVLDSLSSSIDRKFSKVGGPAVLSYEECLARIGLHPSMRIDFLLNMVSKESFWKGEPLERMNAYIDALASSAGENRQAFYRNHYRDSFNSGHADDLVHVALIENLLVSGEYAEATLVSAKYLESAPHSRLAIRLAAKTHFKNGQFEAAEKLFAKCVEIYPDDLDSMDHLALIALQRNDKKAAIYWTSSALDAEDVSARRAWREGKISQLEDSHVTAQRHFENCIELSNYFYPCFDDLDTSLRNSCSPEEIVQYWRLLSARYPNTSKPLQLLGRALMELGRVDDAREAFEGAMRLDPTDRSIEHSLQLLNPS